MSFNNILFRDNGTPVPSEEIRNKVFDFDYTSTVAQTIRDSRDKKLDKNDEFFIVCIARILVNFGMTRAGPFWGVKINDDGNVVGREKLLKCWKAIGPQIIEIRNSIIESRLCRDRFLLELSPPEREELISIIWSMTKKLLPYTMGEYSYGLVGASKILFAILPEIVLPVDNSQWLKLFKTVDIGDVIKEMVLDIQHWEAATGKRLNEMDPQKHLTTLPSVYNVMTMDAKNRL